MKEKWRTKTIVILLVIAGLSLILYPMIGNYLSNLIYRRAIENFQSSVEKLDGVTYDDLLKEAREYNRRLKKTEVWPLVPEFSNEEWADYLSQLDITGTGIMGYIEIPAVGILLPIYHGTSEAVLQKGAGHLEGSSLPIGGESTHSVLSAHTGLPSAKLFTDIDLLRLGDTFSITILQETITYEVDQIDVVAPYEVWALGVVDGEDYCTLLTCTPRGINSHRLLVRGRRVETPVEDTEPVQPDTAPTVVAPQPEPERMDYSVITVSVIVLAGITFVIVAVTLAHRRQGKDKKKHTGKGENI